MGKSKGKQATRHSVVGSSNGKAKGKRGSKVAAEKQQARSENESSGRDGGDANMEDSTAVAHIGKDTSSEGNLSSLDDQLEATAVKKNLSVTNVKSILHHLVKDQRVLKLVQRLAASEDGGKDGKGGSTQQSADDWDELTAYEPRLTRSRVRQAVMSAVATGSLSADKTALLVSSSMTATSCEDVRIPPISDDVESSDEEYNPEISSDDEEEEDELEDIEVDRDEEIDNEEGIDEVVEEGGSTVRTQSVIEGADSNLRHAHETNSESVAVLHTSSDIACASSSCTTSTPPNLSRTLSPSTTSTTPDQLPSVQIHSPTVSTPVTSTQVTPTSSLITPTATPTPALTSPSSPQQDSEVQEAASLLASLTESHNTLSPLKLLMQQTAVSSDISINRVSGVSQETDASSDIAINRVSGVSQETAASSDISINRVSGVSQETATRTSSDISNNSASQDTAVSGNMSIKCASGVSQETAASIDNCAGGVSHETAACSDNSINRISSVSTDLVSSVEGISGICQLDQSNSFHPEVNTTNLAREEGGDTEQEIAKRTRSKCPLHDVSITSLEAGLSTVEGEDPPTPRELDPDELWWHQWLNSLSNDPLSDPLVSHAAEEEEEEEDGEYNFLADCLREEEREEFRNDRAVRIPRKEVDDLITELLNPSIEGSSGLLLSSDGLDLTGAYLLETLGVQIPGLNQATTEAVPAPQLPVPDNPTPLAPSSSSPSSAECYLSKEQTVQLWTQIQQHFQLIMQTFVLARFEPSLVFVSQVAVQALDELSRWCSSSRETDGGRQSVWNIPHLQSGLELVKTLDPYDDSTVKITPSAGTPPKVPEGAQQVFMDKLLFWEFPHFLPASGFTPLTMNSTSVAKYFTPEEERLLVLGMDHYGVNAWKEIQQNILPTKTLKQLKLRVKNRCSKRSGSNVIKEYRSTKKIPEICNDMQPELPQWVFVQEKKLANQETQKQKQIEKVKKILSSAAPSITTKHPVAVKSDVTSSTQSTSDSPVDPASNESRSQVVASGRTHTPAIPGRKRACSEVAVSSVHKRPCVAGTKARQNRGRRLASAQDNQSAVEIGANCSISRVNLGHLLVVAGVQASDPMTRFYFSFLREVKNVTSHSKPSVYNQFVELLQQHLQQEWRPRQLYERVRQLFEPWPHLITFFTEFLSSQDCLEANLLREKHDIQNVKSFLSKLQARYSATPLQLREITDRLKQLDTPSVTRQQVYDSLLPLVEVHQDLADELRGFIFHLAPAARADDNYEEITLDDDEKQHPADEYEQVTLLGCHRSGANGNADEQRNST